MRLFRQITVTASLLFIIMFGLASTCLASERIAVVKSGTANIRSGPGMKYGVTAVAPAGGMLKIVGLQGSWYKVATQPGLGSKTGYAYKGLPLNVIETDATTGDNAYLRSGPGFSFPAVAKLPKGSPLKVVDRDGLWYKVITADLKLNAVPFWVTAKMEIVRLDKEAKTPANTVAAAAPVKTQAPAAAAPAVPSPAPATILTPAATSAPAPAAASTPKQQAASSPAPQDQRWLARNTAGRFLILDDTSYWKVAPGDTGTAASWTAGDNISVMKGNDASYTIVLFNTSRGNGVKVQAIAQ